MLPAHIHIHNVPLPSPCETCVNKTYCLGKCCLFSAFTKDACRRIYSLLHILCFEMCFENNNHNNNSNTWYTILMHNKSSCCCYYCWCHYAKYCFTTYMYTLYKTFSRLGVCSHSGAYMSNRRMHKANRKKANNSNWKLFVWFFDESQQ